MEGFIIEVKINKEIQRYQESILFGLSLRQLVFALLAIGVAVGAYFGLKPLIGAAEVGWVCMLAAFPFAMCGFFTYNGMPAERFLLAVIRSELLCPRTLSYHPQNLYAELLLDSNSMREVLTLAAQIPAELFDRLDRYLKERGIKKKDFLVDSITRALEEAEAAEVTETITETPPNDDGESIPHDEPDEQPEADET